MFYQWLQLKHTNPKKWKASIKLSSVNASDLLVQNHHLTEGERILSLEKMSSKELQSIFISNFTHKISLNSYFEKFFSNIEFDWSNFYNAYLCSFQYKIFSNILFLNKIVLFRMTNTPLCFFFCNVEENTPLHMYIS